MSEPQKIDQGYVQEVRERVKHTLGHASSKMASMGIGPKEVAGLQEAAALSDYQPTTRALLPGGVGYAQVGFIGNSLLPPVAASPDGTEQASYPTFAKEAFFVADDLIALNAEAKETNGGLSWTTCALDVRGKMEWIDERMVRIASTVGQDARAKALDRVKTQVDTGREYRQATLLTTTGTYASASYYTTLTGTDQYSHASSTPLTKWLTDMETLRTVNGRRPNALWMGARPMSRLAYNPQLIALINGGATKASPAFPVTAGLIGQLLGLSVFVGEAVYTSTVGGSFTDVWGDNAGLLYIGPAELDIPKFGCTLTSGGYPQVTDGFERLRGANGSSWVKYVDAYKAVCQLNTAGYLYQDCTA